MGASEPIAGAENFVLIQHKVPGDPHGSSGHGMSEPIAGAESFVLIQHKVPGAPHGSSGHGMSEPIAGAESFVLIQHKVRRVARIPARPPAEGMSWDSLRRTGRP